MPNPEEAVRSAALKLQNAIVDARANGLHVDWPARVEDLSSIAISETGRASVNVIVNADAGVDPAVAAKATAAAQKAADKAIG